MKKKIFLFFAAFIIGIFLPEKVALAGRGEMGRLIQTTTLKEDYQALVYLGLTNTAVLEEKDGEQAYKNVLCSAVRIQVNGHYGSGSIYRMTEEEIIIVTNRHVLQYFNEDSYVTFFDGRVGSGSLLGVSKEADVGFISIPLSGFTYEELLQLRNVRKQEEAYENLKESTRFFMIDMASDVSAPVQHEGTVLHNRQFLADFGMEMLYGDAYAIPGMSGCGIFDYYGNYVGMLSGGTLQNEIAAVPLDVIEREYEKIKNQFT